jgi:hypothetical protein
MICNFLTDDLNKQYICVKFCFQLKKTASKTWKCSKQLSMTMPGEEHTLLSGFLDQNVKNPLAADCESAGCSSIGWTCEHAKKVHKINEDQ